MAETLQLKVVLSAIDKATGPLKKLMAGSQGVASALREQYDAQRQLKAQLADIRAFRTQTDAVRRAHAAFEAQQAKVRELAAQMRAAEAPGKQLTRAFDQARQQAARLKAAHQQQAEALQRLRSTLAAAGIGTRDLGSHERRLRGELERTSAAIAQQKTQLDRLASAQARGQKLHSGGMTVAAHGAGMAFAGQRALRAAAAPVAEAISFESALADVRKVVDGLEDPVAFRQMGRDIQDLSMRLPMTQQGIAQIVAAAGQAGIAREELLRFAEDAAMMGVAFDTTAEDAGQMMATWRTAFRMPQAEVVRLADQINYLGNTGPASVQKISAVVTRIGALGEVAGLQSGPLAALGATIAGVGVEEEIAATGIKNLLLRLTAGEAAAKSQRVAFEKLGLSAEQVAAAMQTDAQGTILDVLERIGALDADVQASVLSNLFGTESVGAIAPLLTNLPQLRENFAKVADAQRYGGSMAAEYASRVATSENALQLARNAARVLAASVGETLLPDIKALAASVAGMIERMVKWTRANPGLVRALALAAAGVAALVTALGGLLTVGGLGAMALGQILKVASLLSGGAGLAGLLGTLGGLLPPLLLVAGAGLLIWKFWQPIKAFLSGVWDGFVQGLQPVLPVLGMLRETLGKILAPAATGEASLLRIANVGQLVGDILGRLATLVIVPLGLALQGLVMFIQWVGTQIGRFAGFIVGHLSALGTILQGVFTLDAGTVMAGFLALWQNINQFFGGLPARLASFGVAMVQGLVDGIRSMLGAPGRALAEMADGAIGTLKTLLDINSPSRVFAQLGQHTIAGLTQGIEAARRGPVAAVAGIAGQVTRAAGTALAAGSLAAPVAMAGTPGPAAAPHYEIHVYATPGMDAQAVARAVAAELDRREAARAARRRSTLGDID